MIRCLTAMASVALLTLSLLGQDEPKSTESATLEGVWKCVDRQLNDEDGKKLAIPPMGDQFLVITGNSYKVDFKPGSGLVGWGRSKGTLKFDRSQTPKRFDDVGKPTWLAIYKVEKDQLTILLRTGERPKDFDDTKRTTFITFEKVMKKKS